MKTLDKVLIAVVSFLAAFIVATVVIYTVNGWQYDTLIPCVVGSGLLETVNTMLITVSKIKRGKNVTDNIGCGSISSDMCDLGDDMAHPSGSSMEEDF